MDPSLASSLCTELDNASSFDGSLLFKMKESCVKINIVLRFCSKEFYKKNEGIEHPSPSQIFDPVTYPPTNEGFMVF